MASRIKGNGDGPNGRNETYTIQGRKGTIRREALVDEVKEGKHPKHGVYTREGEEYVRSNPDHLRKNNVDDPK